MPMTLNQIENEAFKLNNEEKLLLIQDVASSLNVPEIDPAWRKEIKRRASAVSEGKATLIPAEDVFARASEKLKQMRTQK